jgi:hypothetical protein
VLAYVDGERSHGDPRDIPLQALELIQLDIKETA